MLSTRQLRIAPLLMIFKYCRPRNRSQELRNLIKLYNLRLIRHHEIEKKHNIMSCSSAGDKVMQITNDYDVEWKKNGERGKGVFNGDIGIIVEIDSFNGGLLINFEGRVAVYSANMLNKIEHAYAITIHKSQGNEIMRLLFRLPTVLNNYYTATFSIHRE